MVNQWIGRLTTKQIVISLVMVAVVTACGEMEPEQIPVPVVTDILTQTAFKIKLEPTATAIPEPTAIPAEVSPTSTEVIPTFTPAPVAIATVIPVPTPTEEPHTSTQTPLPTATPTPTHTPTYTQSKPYVFEVLDKHPTIECLNENMNVFINVFGLYVISNQSFAPDHAMHTANILAEYIDNDLDGAPDDPAVLSYLQGQNYVVPVWTKDIRTQFWQDARGTFCEDNISMAASLYDDDDWAIGGIKYTRTFDGNLEEVWHVVSRGWYAAYPEYFGNSFDTESILTQAMDIARGGKFYDPPSEYPAGAWYKYSDESCNYNCQISEYFYWAVMANIGALDTSITSKCYPDKDEWNICTKSELKAKDKMIYDLLNNKEFNLPTNIPTGGYKISSE